MLTFLLRRVLLMVPTLWAIATVAFFLVRGAPGGPFQSEKEIPAAARAQLMHKYGLDQPLHVQYLRFLTGVARLDFGPSYKFPSRQVREIIAEALPVSLELGGWALLLAIVVGVPIGIYAAVRQNTTGDFAAMGVALAGVSIPNFVLGPVLVLALSLTLYWLPPALWEGPQSRVLPVLTLAAAYVAYIARLTRAGMLEVLRQDFTRTARAKGLPERAVIYRHALRNALISVITFVGLQFGLLLGGSVVVESLFSRQGLGQLVVAAVFARDIPIVQGWCLLIATTYSLVNLAVDLSYALVNPRIRYDAR